jgi:formylglycine-generating enzyme required for sulfatase activity
MLEPRAREGEQAATMLLAEVVETAAVPRELRFQGAEILGAVGDPRLLDVTTGENELSRHPSPDTRHTPRYWCAIEAGPFWYGDDRREELRQKTLSYRYAIGRYPVTNAEYRRFIEAGGYQERRWWTAQGWGYKEEQGHWTEPRLWNDKEWNQPTQPVVGVSWYEAMAYCAWLTEVGQQAGWLPQGVSIRLPTSLEWERAARGTDRRRYPWGDDEPTEEHANYGKNIGRTTPVGAYPLGAAGCGAMDLAGQVMEWLATPNGAAEQEEPQGGFGTYDAVLLTYSNHYQKAEHLCCGSRVGVDARRRRDFNWGFRLFLPSHGRSGF